MDFWVVAAAAGAGYVAKYWQNIVRDKDGSCELNPSHSSCHDNVELSSLIHRINIKYSNHKLSGSGIGYRNMLEGISGEKSSNDNSSVEDGNLPSSFVYPLEYGKHEKIENESGYVFSNDIGYTGASLGSKRSKNIFTSRHLRLQYVKPRNLLDSCLTPHMHRENAKLKEHFRSPFISPFTTTTLRPFLVTDGRRVISSGSGRFDDKLPTKVHQTTSDGVVGVPGLPLIGGAANFSKEECDKDKSGMQKWNSRCTSFQSDSLDGSPSGQVLFCIGISIGIMCSIISNKLEVEKLKNSLKQSENLVQDLQEELEMKDSLTVKELVYDDDSQDTHENACCDKRVNIFSHQMNTNELAKSKEIESRSKIEAELEAELERLELSMIGSTLQGTLSDDIEWQFDQKDNNDTTPELVHGELNPDMIQQRSSSEPTPDQGTSTTSTRFSPKYAVSPRELSLRLHELIQSQLQNRVTELEEELAKAQKRVRDLESERIISWREVSNSEASSTLGSPVIHSPTAQPLVMNLSDAALDAYNEAYYELNKLNGSGNEERGMFDGRNGAVKITEGTPSDDKADDDNNDDGDDDDLLLIKQIVEKARQGSPAVLRAQRAMVYLDD